MYQPRITLNGMYMYDPTLFDGIVLPSGMSTELMVSQILRQSGDLFPFYQVPSQVKAATTEWFMRRLPNFEKLWTGVTAEYNAIENYDRHEEVTETPDITRTSTTSASKTETPDITQTTTTNRTAEESPELKRTTATNSTSKETPDITHTTTTESNKTETPNITRSTSNNGEDSSTNAAEVAGFDSTGYVPNSKTTTSGTSSSNGTETESGTRAYSEDTTNTEKESGTRSTSGTTETTDTESGKTITTDNATVTATEQGTRQTNDSGTSTDTESGTRKTVSRVHGNIGVTTSAQMLRGELDLRATLDLYVVIASEYEADNLLQIY